MRNFLLILFLSLGLLNFSYAGGDDRDQQLPLNSLNSEQEINEEGVPRFLQEDDTVIQDEEIQKGQREIEEIIQTKILDQQPTLKYDDSLNISTKRTGKFNMLANKYLQSEEVILLVIILFVIAIILFFSFFIR